MPVSLGAAEGETEAHSSALSCPAGSEWSSTRAQAWGRVLIGFLSLPLVSCGPGKGLREQGAWPTAKGPAPLLWKAGAEARPLSLVGELGQQSSGWVCPIPIEDAAVKGRLVECLETVLNKAQEPPKSKKVQHSNAKNAILFETISLIIHYDRCSWGLGPGAGWGAGPGPGGGAWGPSS